MSNTQQFHSLTRDAFTLKETAAKLGISYVSAFRLVQRGLLRPCGALRIKLITQAEIDRFLRETQMRN